MAATGAVQSDHSGKTLAVVLWQEAIDADGFVAAFETDLGLDYGKHESALSI
jgi:hypothetical protein